jgi:hypothetical protein
MLVCIFIIDNSGIETVIEKEWMNRWTSCSARISMRPRVWKGIYQVI